MSFDSKQPANGRGEAGSLAGEAPARRVLVTGAGGFVGRAVVVRLLEQGWTVEAVSSGARSVAAGSGLCWHQADLLDGDRVEALLTDLRPSHLVHLAWAPNRGIYASPENFRWVGASLRLLESFFDNGGKRTVFAGSSAEYDWSAGVCRERGTALSGGGAYGAGKRALCELFQGVCELRRGRAADSDGGQAGAPRAAESDGVGGAWARIFFLFGPHEPDGRLVAAVSRALLEGGPVRCSEGTQIRDYLYVEDAADALVRLLDSDLSGPVNIASGEGIRVRDLVLQLAGRLGGGGAERIEWGAVGQGATEAPLVVADVRRLREELDWRPRMGLAEGLDRTLTWWRQRLESEPGAGGG